MRLEYRRIRLRLSREHRAAHGTVRERELLAVRLLDDDGAAGNGEAAPLPSYDGVTIERVERALAAYAEVIARPRDAQPTGVQVLEECREADPLAQALAAVDVAFWDLAATRRGVPLAQLICDDPAASVAVNATLSATDRAGAAEEAARAAAAGFGCVKVKVGTGDDAGRVAAVRAGAGPEMSLRLDANGAWDVEQAVRMIEALAPAGLELVEEPVHGLAAIRQVRERVPVRIAVDETAAEPGALGAGVADAVCLKLSRCGGIGPLLAAAALVRASGAEPYLASTLDGPVGVAAALHAAAALASRGPLPWCGLATLDLFEGIGEPLPVRDGRIALPQGPGLGVEPPGAA